ncbi:MAG: ABC transporter substrate-binding protein [Lachnospiraceae bacterium]|nr:ABC transporter substrate-binding protein [Lachnospiraceae bacterium]
MKKKILTLLLAATMTASVFTGCSDSKERSKTETTAPASGDETTTADNSQQKEKIDINMAVLKGPTAIGFIKAWEDSDKGTASNNYKVTAYGAADEISAGIIKGDIDIAAVPCNLASVLYNKTKGEIQVAAINTLGVLYMVSTGEEIDSIAGLKGKTIYSTGQGTTPEYTLNYILTKNGLTPGTDVTVEYKTEAAEIASLLSENKEAIAMLPQPYVTTVLLKNENAKIIFDMTEEWSKVSDNASLVTGVVVVRKDFIEEHKDAFDSLMNDYEASASYVNDNIEEAAALVESHDIFAASVAKKAIPYCNITFKTGEEMKKDIHAYLEVLHTANPASVGGALPDDKFYYIP